MEIKYEAVFGDQSLFDGAEPDVFLVETNGVYKTFHKETSGKVTIWTRNGCDLAMRRIIKKPNRWTMEDQKAGRLPEVGCRVNFCHKLNTNWRTGEIKYIDDQVAVIKADDIDRPFVYEVDRVEFKPIESPEEKAARLREEWCNEAGLVCSLGMTTLTRIYEALLSGDLPVPAKGE